MNVSEAQQATAAALEKVTELAGELQHLSSELEDLQSRLAADLDAANTNFLEVAAAHEAANSSAMQAANLTVELEDVQSHLAAVQ